MQAGRKASRKESDDNYDLIDYTTMQGMACTGAMGQ